MDILALFPGRLGPGNEAMDMHNHQLQPMTVFAVMVSNKLIAQYLSSFLLKINEADKIWSCSRLSPRLCLMNSGGRVWQLPVHYIMPGMQKYFIEIMFTDLEVLSVAIPTACAGKWMIDAAGKAKLAIDHIGITNLVNFCLVQKINDGTDSFHKPCSSCQTLELSSWLFVTGVGA